MAIGLCRIRDARVNKSGVRILYQDGRIEEITADRYAAKGYMPIASDLPWAAPISSEKPLIAPHTANREVFG
jgi:hypothetical protein